MNTDHHLALPPMSKHHVLHMARVSSQLPPYLFRPLLVLAVHADHRTGLSRPGRKVFEKDWGIPYSSWHRQMQQLAKLGIIEQVVKGSQADGLAATYRLLYVPPLADERTSTGPSAEDPSPHRGGGAIGEKGRGDQPLNEAENQLWARLSDRVRACLEPGENRRLTEQSRDFDRMTRLKRTALRLAQRGGDFEVIEALTRRKKAGRPAYEGATSIPAAMWSRLRALADVYGIEMADQSPVVVMAEAKVPFKDSLAALEKVVPGIGDAIRGLGSV